MIAQLDGCLDEADASGISSNSTVPSTIDMMKARVRTSGLRMCGPEFSVLELAESLVVVPVRLALSVLNQVIYVVEH